MNKVLSIAGTDPTGGAGSAADYKTFSALKVYGMNITTAVVAQNTVAVFDVCSVSIKNIKKQFDAVFTDIYPDAIKIGMVFSTNLIKTIRHKLDQYQPQNIVLDPVMVSTSGAILLKEDAKEALINLLFPIAKIITPNIKEAEILANMIIDTDTKMEEAAKIIAKMTNAAILIKGGHSKLDANDYLYQNGVGTWILGKRIANNNTHGTGCTLSSAIASYLAKGYDIKESVLKAKEFVTKALERNLNLGQGSGPLDHLFKMED